MKKYYILVLFIVFLFSGCSAKHTGYTDVYTHQELSANKAGVDCDTMTKEKSPETEISGDNIVYITKSGSKYHTTDCPKIKDSKITTTVQAATAAGITPCLFCTPGVR